MTLGGGRCIIVYIKPSGHKTGRHVIMAKKKFSIVKVLLILAIVVVAGYFVYNHILKTPTPTPPGPIVDKLATPTGVAYDENTSTLSWNAVDNATGYVVSYNDIPYQVSETSKYILPTAEQNVFKVKAVGDGIDYSDSDWSQECTYTMTTTTISVFEKVNLQLAKTASESGLTLVRVVGISYADIEKTSSGTNLSFEVICNDSDKNVNARISYGFDGFDSVYEMLESINVYTKVSVVDYDIVDYNSVEELLLSNSFDGKMEEMRKAGYTFTVVDNCVRKGSKSGSSFYFSIVATFKAEKDGEVRYFTSVNQIKIYTDQRDEPTNYEIAVGYVDYRQVTEHYFVEHTHGPTWDYIQDLVGESDTQD